MFLPYPGPWVQGSRGENGGDITITASGSSVKKIFLPILIILLVLLVYRSPKEGMLPLNWKLSQPPGHFKLPVLLNQWAKKELTLLAWVTD